MGGSWPSVPPQTPTLLTLCTTTNSRVLLSWVEEEEAEAEGVRGCSRLAVAVAPRGGGCGAPRLPSPPKPLKPLPKPPSPKLARLTWLESGVEGSIGGSGGGERVARGGMPPPLRPGSVGTPPKAAVLLPMAPMVLCSEL